MFINFYNPYDYAMAGDPEASKAYVEEWKKRNLPWIGVVEGMRGFDAVNVVAKAIEAAKEPTAPKIMAALKTLEMRGLYGLNKFDQNGQSYCNIIVTPGQGRQVLRRRHDAQLQAVGDVRRQVAVTLLTIHAWPAPRAAGA